MLVQAPGGAACEHVCGVHVRPQVRQQPEQALQTIPQETLHFYFTYILLPPKTVHTTL